MPAQAARSPGNKDDFPSALHMLISIPDALEVKMMTGFFS
jgi:hypothetical protein